MVKKLLDSAQIKISELDAIAIIAGPGSFTGLRIGSAVAQGLAFAHEIPIVMCSSLAVMAMRATQLHAAQNMLVAMQAREGEYYWAVYSAQEGSVILQEIEHVLSLEGVAALLTESAVVASEKEWAGVGDGWREDLELTSLPELTDIMRFPEICTDAEVLALLAEQKFLRNDFCAPESAVPVYLKEQLEYK